MKRAIAVMVMAGMGVAGQTVMPPSDKVETVVVELGPHGFYPAEVVRQTTGKYYLLIRVNLGQDSTPLRLENEGGAVLKDSAKAGNAKRWGQLVDVPAGNYFIRVPGKPAWALRMTIPAGGPK